MNKIVYDKEEILHIVSQLYQEIVDAEKIFHGSIKDRVTSIRDRTATVTYLDYSTETREVTFVVRMK